MSNEISPVSREILITYCPLRREKMGMLLSFIANFSIISIESKLVRRQLWE